MLLFPLNIDIRHLFLEKPTAEIIEHQFEEYDVDSFGLFCELTIGNEIADEEVTNNRKMLSTLWIEDLQIRYTSFLLAEAIPVNLLTMLNIATPGQPSKKHIVIVTFL